MLTLEAYFIVPIIKHFIYTKSFSSISLYINNYHIIYNNQE